MSAELVNGLARVLVGEKIGFVNRHGELINEPIFDAADGFSEGLAAVCIGSDWGYIDTAGAFVIEPQFWQAGKFRGGKAHVECWDDQNPVWIEVTGNSTTPMEPTPNEKQELAESLIRAGEGDLWGFQDPSGVWGVEPTFRDAGDFANGLARVKNDEGLWGYIDQQGTVRIPFEFEDVRDFMPAEERRPEGSRTINRL